MKYLNFAVFLGYKVLLKCSVKSIIMSYIPCEAVRKNIGFAWLFAVARQRNAWLRGLAECVI